ncbi:hypothetical protein LPTSP3_g09460 [Leptospira kobayashii]|uniref:Ankyrin repeat protein n=1 Tax=Leptospira kobayashii TaxID=1917830 RepID=A0ABM7UHA7_9LEPT|nr:ankyrin repeat domain-containing protein [Leptospira kobayashii]BDA78016.1 hypothetical protein LPTSP3_g09460 [Leptospira kobayashii]
MFAFRIGKQWLGLLSAWTQRNRFRNLIKSMLDGDRRRFDVLLDVLKSDTGFGHSAPLLLGLAAVETEDPYFLETLLSSGLDPNRPNEQGIFPLHTAVENGKKESVLILLIRGANPDVCDPDQVTPLHIANSYDGLGEISDLLLEYGANPNRRDRLGKRYLM